MTPATPLRLPRFTESDASAAYDSWGCNCGPGALAAICDLTLDEVRPHIPDFDAKRYTNPSMMNAALRSLDRGFVKIGKRWPEWGLVRVQWHGPWTAPGVPMAARYRYTHWIGAAEKDGGARGVFDINCMNNGSGWCAFGDWAKTIVPFLTSLYPRADGEWSVTHSLQVSRTP